MLSMYIDTVYLMDEINVQPTIGPHRVTQGKSTGTPHCFFFHLSLYNCSYAEWKHFSHCTVTIYGYCYGYRFNFS